MAYRRLFYLTGFTVFLFLVSPVSAQNQSGLELSSPRFKQQQSVNFNPRFSVARSGVDDYLQGEVRPSSATLEKNIYSTSWSSRAEAIAHNTSSKSIKAIDWEYFFFADASMDQVLGRYRIHTKKKLRPGETKILKGYVFSRVLSPYQKALPLRIEYTDGTVWQSP